MKYYWLTPKDQRQNNWLLHRETASGVSLHSRYADLQCARCRKVDELAALERGLDADARIRSSSDFLMTDDGFVCGSQSFRDALAAHHVANVVYVPVSAASNYFVVLPATFAPMLNENVGMEFHRVCKACGRYSETCLFAAIESFAKGTDPFALLCLAIPQENVRGRQFWYCVTQQLAAVLKAEKLKGLEYMEAY